MSSQHDELSRAYVRSQAQRHYKAWREAYTDRTLSDTDANIEAEQKAYDRLVDYVEANDLNHSAFDPR
jgi:hypothetical protein